MLSWCCTFQKILNMMGATPSQLSSWTLQLLQRKRYLRDWNDFDFLKYFKQTHLLAWVRTWTIDLVGICFAMVCQSCPYFAKQSRNRSCSSRLLPHLITSYIVHIDSQYQRPLCSPSWWVVACCWPTKDACSAPCDLDSFGFDGLTTRPNTLSKDGNDCLVSLSLFIKFLISYGE